MKTTSQSLVFSSQELIPRSLIDRILWCVIVNDIFCEKLASLIFTNMASMTWSSTQ